MFLHGRPSLFSGLLWVPVIISPPIRFWWYIHSIYIIGVMAILHLLLVESHNKAAAFVPPFASDFNQKLHCKPYTWMLSPIEAPCTHGVPQTPCTAIQDPCTGLRALKVAMHIRWMLAETANYRRTGQLFNVCPDFPMTEDVVGINHPTVDFKRATSICSHWREVVHGVFQLTLPIEDTCMLTQAKSASVRVVWGVKRNRCGPNEHLADNYLRCMDWPPVVYGGVPLVLAVFYMSWKYIRRWHEQRGLHQLVTLKKHSHCRGARALLF